ncbi:DUF6994 family protein [Methanimicrococcus hongohii]|nr:hypothetical protein [Methanimicrococcus sp. Hf6]
MKMKIDTSYRTDYSNGKDPDAIDSILRDYHQLLWSKSLPCGKMFDLQTNENKPYRLFHESDLGSFSLSSDAITHTFTFWDKKPWKRISEVVKDVPQEDIDAFFDLGCTIGSYIIFPANQINMNTTINQERGTHPNLLDRFDFTLECIRRWYIGERSPLIYCLNRYSDFFRLFSDFKGYVEFFLLDDLVDENKEQVSFWLPFKEFGITPPLPKDADEYKIYMENASNFIKARNKRIDEAINYEE